MATHALTPFHTQQVKSHFISNIDAAHSLEILRHLNPESTLLIIASKTFTTTETLQNAQMVKQWLLPAVNSPTALKPHLIAITAFPERAANFGVAIENCFPIWDWVGGRYSLWSAMGLPLLLSIGIDNFQALLAGATAMDQHFRNTPFTHNMPVIMALLGIWYHNFYAAQTQAILPYTHLLQDFPSYLQQTDMESNGKRTCHNGTEVNYTTGPIIWGGVGCNSQHAFHQLLLQGTHLIPADFIIPATVHHDLNQHHAMLFANCLSQSQALMQGKTLAQAITELTANGKSISDSEQLAPHLVIPGNCPSNTLVLSQLTPYTLGTLLALYEHKIFVQGIIWGINSFDQWGVELGKQLAKKLLPDLQQPQQQLHHDASTNGLIDYYWQQQLLNCQ
jgi:glucose-6-phosphate isomerase